MFAQSGATIDGGAQFSQQAIDHDALCDVFAGSLTSGFKPLCIRRLIRGSIGACKAAPGLRERLAQVGDRVFCRILLSSQRGKRRLRCGVASRGVKRIRCSTRGERSGLLLCFGKSLFEVIDDRLRLRRNLCDRVPCLGLCQYCCCRHEIPYRELLLYHRSAIDRPEGALVLLFVAPGLRPDSAAEA